MPGDTPQLWHLRIAAGPNAGAELALQPGTYSVGSATDNDIVLSDASMAGQHLSLEIGARGASLVAHAEGAALQGRAMLPGRTLRLATGAELRLGETVLHVSAPPTAAPAVSRRLLGGIAAAICVVAAALTYTMAPQTPAQRRAAPARMVDVADLGTAHRDMAAHLRSVGFGGGLQVASVDGALVVTGALLPADQPAWRDAQAWFDARFKGRFSLVSHTGAATADLLPQLDIAAVSLSPVASVITRDGERYTTGAVLPGGWTIAAIAVDAVTLRRQGRDVRITL